ncbi:MAG: dTDP-4-amino-4,6-dideoxygalactose transaminase [Pseudomonadota bacterium]
MDVIPFNKPCLHGRELVYIAEAVASGKISGDGIFTKKCHNFFEKKYGFQKTLMTTSCTDALEMSAILLGIRDGDEVIVPSYTFVSTANAFVLRGAKIVFADSCEDNPNINPDNLSQLITKKTKAIVVVHYAGVACNMSEIMRIARDNNISVVEDAAQAVDSYFDGAPLGGIGDIGTFSFHETKNVISGEGGLLVLNDSRFNERAEIIREKGTNRSSFFRGEVNKYGWVDIGSSFLPSDIISAYLYAQLEVIKDIQDKRISIWNDYFSAFSGVLEKKGIELPSIPAYASNNAHMFYITCSDLGQRSALIDYLNNKGIAAVFHYQSLHKSPYFASQYSGPNLTNCDRYSDCLLRLPLFYEMKGSEVDYVCSELINGVSSL